MTDYNEGLFDGMLATFTLEYIDADAFWELLTDQHFNDVNANILNVHVTEWCDTEKKVELIAACPDKKAVAHFLETFVVDYQEELTEACE